MEKLGLFFLPTSGHTEKESERERERVISWAMTSASGKVLLQGPCRFAAFLVEFNFFTCFWAGHFLFQLFNIFGWCNYIRLSREFGRKRMPKRNMKGKTEQPFLSQFFNIDNINIVSRWLDYFFNFTSRKICSKA